MPTESSNISVVITCHSEGELIWDAVNSVRQQSYSPLEIIVVNDASTDSETIHVCQQLEDHPEIKIIWREENGGPSAARNDGFQAARGEILVLLDADDILPEGALEAIHQAFDAYPDAGFIYGGYLRQDQVSVPAKQIHPGEVSLKSMLSPKRFSLSSNWKLIGTTPLRRSLWASIGGYDVNFGVEDLHDVEFWIRAIASGHKYYSIPETIYVWRKYLGKNSRFVTPLAWYRVAQKHLAVYEQLGLGYRAYELLLLGSKWLGHRTEAKTYTQQLIRCVQHSHFQLSTLFALAIPTLMFQLLAQYAQQRR